jgi:large subunit ribosomal protein L19
MNYPRLKAIYEHKGMKALPIKTGQLLEIHEIVPQGDSTRISKFKGLVIQVKNPSSPTGTFTIRGASPLGRGTLERVFPLGYHKFDKVILLDAYKIRRSKIFYIREKI